MYLQHLAISTVSQNSLIPAFSSSLLVGFTSRLTYSFNSCHKFSMGFRSSDSGGVFHQLIPSCVKKAVDRPDVCFGSLSYINLCESMYVLRMKGTRPLCIMVVYRSASIMPSKRTIRVGPLLLMPAQTCTFDGCFGRGFNTAGSPFSL